jgi:hypothetical protein
MYNNPSKENLLIFEVDKLVEKVMSKQSKKFFIAGPEDENSFSYLFSLADNVFKCSDIEQVAFFGREGLSDIELSQSEADDIAEKLLKLSENYLGNNPTCKHVGWLIAADACLATVRNYFLSTSRPLIILAKAKKNVFNLLKESNIAEFKDYYADL